MKILAFLLVMGIFLAGCTPVAAPATPSLEDISTQVSIQLTSLPSPTQAPLPTATVFIPTAFPSPTASTTPEATASPAPTSPVSELGEPTWKESFNSPASFGLGADGYEDDYTQIKIADGALVLTSRTKLSAFGWRTGGPNTAQKAHVEGIFSVGACSGSDLYGLVLRSPDFIDGYMLTVTCGGAYVFGYWKDGGFTELRSGENTPGLNTGPNQNNRLGVRSDGQHFALYANGELVQEIDDSTFADGGHTGALVAGAETDNFTVRVDELAFWNLP